MIQRKNIGYCCINLTLQEQDITTNRSLIQKTFLKNGLDYVSELALKNIIDLKKIIEWNIANKIGLFRMSSCLLPWWSEYNFEQLKDYTKISSILKDIGSLCIQNGHRISFHPDHFDKLCSSDPRIINNTLKDIEQHSLILDLMGFIPSHYNKINIHVGGSYGDKNNALNQFCINFEKLSDNCKKRLTVENDDKEALYTVKELMYLHNRLGIPIVFDYLHHAVYNDMSEQEAFDMAYGTWKNEKPVFHYSEACEKIRKHSELINEQINDYNKDVDIMVEAKGKEMAVLGWLKRYEK